MARSKSTNYDMLTYWSEHGIHVPRRTINMIGDIDDDMAEHIVSATVALLGEGSTPITYLLDTTGGLETAGLTIFDTIRQAGSVTDTTIIVVGRAWSMGAIILQAADMRIMWPNATLMLHVGDKSYEGHAENVRRELLFDKKIDEVCDTIILDAMRKVNPELTMGQLRSDMTLDTYYLADDTVRLGLADVVGG